MRGPDWLDHVNAGAVFHEMMKNQQLGSVMQERMRMGARMPGWVPLADFDWYATLEGGE